MSLCLAAAGVAVNIVATTFTLSWTHTIEKTAWQEDWRVAGDRLVILEARIQGSGAGMDPPPEARLKDGFYAWAPQPAERARVVLRRAPEAGDWTLCAAGRCDTLAAWLGRKDADPVTLTACAAARDR